MDLLIKNGRVVDPARRIDAVVDVVIRGGKITSIGKANVADIPHFDATGLIVAPGFFDIHVHLREPGTEEAETIATGGAAAVAGGFVAVAAMPNTKPPNDNPSITSYIISEAKRSSPALVFPIGAVTREQKGETLAEIGEMVEAGIVGISDDGKPVMDGRLFRRALEYAQLFNLPVIQHCEDLNLSKGGVMHEGVYSTRLGLKGIPSSAEDTMVSRDLILAMIDTLESNRIPLNIYQGEVFCSRYGLHVDWYENPEGNKALFDIMDRIDGTMSIAEIARACGVSFDAVKRVVDQLRERGLADYV